MEEEAEAILSFEDLPYVCLMVICEYLDAFELAKFSRLSKACYDVACSERLWRRHCLRQWQFCDIHQISPGPRKWRRYYLARKRVENRMDQGRPTKDYRVKSLRGHKADIISTVCLSGLTTDIEHPSPPSVISLSSDSVVYGWKINESKPSWRIEDRQVTCIKGDSASNTVATGDINGCANIHSASDWSVKYSLASPVQGSVTALEFVKYHTLSSILVAHTDPTTNNGTIVVWDLTKSTEVVKLSCDQSCDILSYHSNWIASGTQSDDKIYAWYLPSILPRPHATVDTVDPSVIVHTSHYNKFLWLRPGVLATCGSGVLQPHPLQVLSPPQPHPQVVPPNVLLHHRRPFAIQSSVEVWQVGKHYENSKSRANAATHLYDSEPVGVSATSVSYSNDLLVCGTADGAIKVIKPQDGSCIQTFNDHEGPVTGVYSDAYRVLSCSSDYSIRVYRWVRHGNTHQLESRYQLLGGSIAHKTHNGFNYVTCEAGSCVGVAGDVIKLYNFTHQLEQDE